METVNIEKNSKKHNNEVKLAISAFEKDLMKNVIKCKCISTQNRRLSHARSSSLVFWPTDLTFCVLTDCTKLVTKHNDYLYMGVNSLCHKGITRPYISFLLYCEAVVEFFFTGLQCPSKLNTCLYFYLHAKDKPTSSKFIGCQQCTSQELLKKWNVYQLNRSRIIIWHVLILLLTRNLLVKF